MPGSGAQGSLAPELVMLAQVLLGQPLLPSRYSESAVWKKDFVRTNFMEEKQTDVNSNNKYADLIV